MYRVKASAQLILPTAELRACQKMSSHAQIRPEGAEKQRSKVWLGGGMRRSLVLV